MTPIFKYRTKPLTTFEACGLTFGVHNARFYADGSRPKGSGKAFDLAHEGIAMHTAWEHRATAGEAAEAFKGRLLRHFGDRPEYLAATVRDIKAGREVTP